MTLPRRHVLARLGRLGALAPLAIARPWAPAQTWFRSLATIKMTQVPCRGSAQALPGVPTMASLRYPCFASDPWYGLFVPAGTPEAVVRKIEQDVQRVTQQTRLRGQMWQRGAEIAYLPAPALGQMVRADSARWARIAQATGARAE